METKPVAAFAGEEGGRAYITYGMIYTVGHFAEGAIIAIQRQQCGGGPHFINGQVLISIKRTKAG